MNNKTKLDLLIDKHYQYLLEVAGGVCIKKSSTNNRIKFDLLHDSIIDIYDRLNSSNTFLKSDNDFLNYMKKYLKQKYFYERSMSHNRQRDYPLFSYTPINNPDTINFMIDNKGINKQEEQLIILEAENTNEETKDFLRDIIYNDLTIERGLQFISVMQLYDNRILSDRERYLFHSIFLDKQTPYQIYKESNTINKKSTEYYALLAEVKQLKEKIKNIINDN